MISVRSVSYTHLDVYKRQVTGLANLHMVWQTMWHFIIDMKCRSMYVFFYELWLNILNCTPEAATGTCGRGVVVLKLDIAGDRVGTGSCIYFLKVIARAVGGMRCGPTGRRYRPIIMVTML